MSKDELVALIDQSRNVLEVNRQIWTDEMLTRAERILSFLDGQHDLVAPVLSLLDIPQEEYAHLLTQFRRVVEIERQLVETSQTDNALHALTVLRNRPLMLRMIAALL